MEKGGVAAMRAMVVYESMYGNTRRVADAVGAGLAAGFDVRVVPVSEASTAVLAGADLVVVGGPTHVHGMSRASTRKAADDAASKPGNGLRAGPGVLGPGLREWFGSLGECQARAAAFDTRMHGPAVFTGRASRRMARQLRAHGCVVVAKPASFLVRRGNQLEPEETARARAWGARLAAGITPG